MSYGVLQTRRFARQYKKLQNNIVVDVDQAVMVVANDPHIGERKKVTWPICTFISFVAMDSFICWAIRWTTRLN